MDDAVRRLTSPSDYPWEESSPNLPARRPGPAPSSSTPASGMPNALQPLQSARSAGLRSTNTVDSRSDTRPRLDAGTATEYARDIFHFGQSADLIIERRRRLGGEELHPEDEAWLRWAEELTTRTGGPRLDAQGRQEHGSAIREGRYSVEQVFELITNLRGSVHPDDRAYLLGVAAKTGGAITS